MTRTRKMNKVLSCVIAVALMLSLLPVTAMAAEDGKYDTWAKVEDVTVDGVTYYDVYGNITEDRNDDLNLLFTDALEKVHPKSGTPLYLLWNRISQGLTLNSDDWIGSENVRDMTFEQAYDSIFDGWGSGRNSNAYRRKSDGTLTSDDYEQDRRSDYIINQGLKISNYENLGSDIADEIKENFVGVVQRWGDYGNFVDGKDNLQQTFENAGINEDNGPFYYTISSVPAEYDNQGITNAAQMLSWGTIFYDFKIEYLNVPVESAISKIDVSQMEEDSMELYDYVSSQPDTVPGITYEISTDKVEHSVGGVNQSSEEVELTIEYGTDTTEEATNTRTHSEEYTLGEHIDTGIEIQKDVTFGTGTTVNGGFTWNLNIGFESTQMWNDTWEDSTTYSNSTSKNTSSTIMLPGHTQILLETGTGNTAFSLDYDAPIAVTYKTMCFGQFFVVNRERPNDPHEVWAETTPIFATFGTGASATGSNVIAASNLYNRVLNAGNQSYEIYYGSNLDMADVLDNNWNKKEEDHAVDFKETARWIGQYQPYSVTGGTLAANVKSMNTKIYGLEPLYPLAKVTTDEAFDYNLVVGDKLYLDNIPLYGYNSANVPYYGFDASKGEWKIVDESGNEIDSDVISIEVNPLTGYATLEAKSAGSAYIQYFIDEDEYSSALSIGETENVNVDRVAIPITVTNELFDNGSIAISGELIGYVGDEPVAIESFLDAQIKDAEGKYQNRVLSWEAQEFDGVTVDEAGMISFTKPGTYHIRAICGNVKSHVTDPWYEVVAYDTKYVDDIDVDLSDLIIFYENDMLDLSVIKNNAVAYDQYGNEWTGNWKQDAKWHLDGQEYTNAMLEASNLEEKDYILTLEYNGASSEETTLRVVRDLPEYEAITPANTILPYTGGIIEFKVSGENLANGMIISADNGTDTIYGSTTGSGSVQSAFIEFPENESSDELVIYTVSVGGVNATVTVSKAPVVNESEELDLVAFKTQFKAVSLTLTDNIAMNFKVVVSEPMGYDKAVNGDYAVGALFWTAEPNAYTILGNPELQIETNGVNSDKYRAEEDTGYHVFTYDDIAAKQMNDRIYAVAYVKTNGRYIYSRPLDYSVKDFAHAVLNGNYSKQFDTLAVDMLNYGSQAQNYFGYNSEALANAELTAEQAALGTQGDVSLTDAQARIGTASDYAQFVSASLSLEDYVSLNYKAEISNMDGYTLENVELIYAPSFTDEETWITDRDAGNLLVAVMSDNGISWNGTIRDIAAKGMRDKYYAQVRATYTNGSETLSQYSDILQFSVESYAYLAQQIGTDELKALTVDLMKYGDSANEYFKTLQ